MSPVTNLITDLRGLNLNDPRAGGLDKINDAINGLKKENIEIELKI